MSVRTRLWSAVAGALAVPLALWRFLMYVRGGLPWYVTVLFVITGIAAAFAVWRTLSKRWKGDMARETDRELDQLFGKADQALKYAKSDVIAKRKVVLVCGPQGSAKTSNVVHSDLEAQLLAGPGGGTDDVPPPTETANLWYAEGRVIVEAAGDLMESPDRWKRLAARLQPSRLVAALLRKPHPPRSVVLCLDIEYLTGGKGGDLDRVGKDLRARLQELSKALGVRLPVYVVFTRTDRVKGFEEYASTMSREEAGEVLGATLRLPTGSSDPASRVEEVRRGVGEALDGVVWGLSKQRVRQISREEGLADRAAAFEFPREIQKLRDRMVELLAETFRPAHLHDDAVLRGIYFTGVRPVVTDLPFEERVPARRPQHGPAGATALFLGASPSQGAARAAPGGRRIPAWTFLTRFFPDVVFADSVAEELTRTGTRADVLRQVAYATVALLVLVVGTGATVSFFHNRDLAEDVRASLAAVRPLAATTPVEDALPRLDTLASLVSTLRAYEEEGAPLGYRWTLYRGDRIYPAARDGFVRGYRAVLGGRLAGRLEQELRDPGLIQDYGRGFTALKAYRLLTGSHPEGTLAEEASWFDRAVVERVRLAEPDADSATVRRLAGLYTTLRVAGEIAPEPEVPGLGERARATLLQANDEERIFLRVAQAGADATPVTLAGFTVPAPFTADGWVLVQDELQRLLAGVATEEEWVLDTVMSREARREVEGVVRQRYTDTYVQYWDAYLDRAAELRIEDPRDLLDVLDEATRNTAAEPLPESIRQRYQPVRVAGDTEAAEAYMDALSEMFFANRARRGGANPTADGAALEAANRAEAEAAKIIRNFSSDAAPNVSQRVETLLTVAPRAVRAAVEQGPRLALRTLARDFCRRDFGPVWSGFPFARSEQGADVDDLKSLLHPRDGAAWEIGNRLVEDQHAARSGDLLRVDRSAANPASEGYLDFLNRMTALATDGFYASGTPDPEIRFRLAVDVRPPVEWVEYTLGGQVGRWTPNRQQSHSFRWDGAREPSTLRIQVDGRQLDVVSSGPDPWSVFRVFDRAEWRNAAPPSPRYDVAWPVPGENLELTGTVIFSEARLPILDPDFLVRYSCSEAILR